MIIADYKCLCYIHIIYTRLLGKEFHPLFNFNRGCACKKQILGSFDISNLHFLYTAQETQIVFE